MVDTKCVARSGLYHFLRLVSCVLEPFGPLLCSRTHNHRLPCLGFATEHRDDPAQQGSGQRRTESMLIPVTELLMLVVLLGFCWYALVALRRSENSDAQLAELLIQEILPDDPSLLSANLPSRLSHSNADNRPVQ